MTAASDADRAKAAEVIDAWDADDHGTYADLAARFAAALAAERAAAVEQITADVLGLAEELEGWRANAERYADAHAGSIACDRALGRVRAYERAAARLRAVVADAEEAKA